MPVNLSRRAPKPYTFSEYPKMVWDPETGEGFVAKGAYEVPDGYLDRHPKDPKHAPVAVAEGAEAPSEFGALSVAEMDRRAVLDALRRRGASFNARASTDELRALLAGRPQ